MNILNQLYFLAISHLPASTVATISGALESAFNNNVKPEMKAIGNIIMYIISGVLIIAFVVKGVFVWRDYRHNGGEIRTARSVYLPCGCCFRALVDVERHWVVMTYVCKLIARGSLSLCVLSAHLCCPHYAR